MVTYELLSADVDDEENIFCEWLNKIMNTKSLVKK